MTSNPSKEYSDRLAARQRSVEHYRRLNRFVAGARLAVAVLFVAIVWLVFRAHVMSQWWSLVPVVIFILLLAYHENVLARGRRALRSAAFYERGLARIEDRWIGAGATRVLADQNHLYAADLDLFGKGSLFELLSTARTRSGETTLASWLLAPASRAEILARQQAVEELRTNIDLREDLAVLGEDIEGAIHPELMKRWARAPLILESRAAQMTAPVLAVFTVASLISYFFFDGNGWITVFALATQSVFALLYRRRVREVALEVEQPEKDLELLAKVLSRVEQERFRCEKLSGLRASLDADGKAPSKHIAWLARLTQLLHSRLNMMFTAVSYLFLWMTQIAFAIESWRRRCGPVVPRWLDTVGEFEALCALAGYAYEHPGDPFPEILDAETNADRIFDGDELCHPLLPSARCVSNSIRLNTDLQLLVVSGSNMSGKSTLLRTVGVNVILALAGAPVRAKRLRLSVFRIGATIRVQDSLQAGTSRFYAEIQRLREIMDLTKNSVPVLFLLDEILHGTNSHDRAVGAEAVVRGLIDRAAIGLVTTHDLALAKVADALAPRAANVHFQDHLEAGKMAFDYRLHPGIVQKSNALELMRAVGLEV